MTTVLLLLLVVITGATLAVLVKLMSFVQGLDIPEIAMVLQVDKILAGLTTAADLAAEVARDLKIDVAVSSQQFSRLVILLDRLQIDATATAASGVRIEAEGDRVASDLADVQSHARIIEAEPTTPPGSAADFAAGGNDRPMPKVARKRRN